jgi:hypothetical protein
MGNTATQGAVQPYKTVPTEETGQTELRFPTIAAGAQVDLLVLDRAPQLLHHDIRVEALSSGPTDPDLPGLQPGNKVRGSELASLVGI